MAYYSESGKLMLTRTAPPHSPRLTPQQSAESPNGHEAVYCLNKKILNLSQCSLLPYTIYSSSCFIKIKTGFSPLTSTPYSNFVVYMKFLSPIALDCTSRIISTRLLLYSCPIILSRPNLLIFPIGASVCFSFGARTVSILKTVGYSSSPIFSIAFVILAIPGLSPLFGLKENNSC